MSSLNQFIISYLRLHCPLREHHDAEEIGQRPHHGHQAQADALGGEGVLQEEVLPLLVAREVGVVDGVEAGGEVAVGGRGVVARKRRENAIVN